MSTPPSTKKEEEKAEEKSMRCSSGGKVLVLHAESPRVPLQEIDKQGMVVHAYKSSTREDQKFEVIICQSEI